jgi:flagellar protein FlgJ
MDIKSVATIGLKQQAGATDNVKEEKLHKACADFEAIILRQMLKLMRDTVPKDGLLPPSYSTEMYQGMHDAALADNLAHGKGMGLGELLYQQLSGQVSPYSRK